MNPLLDHAPLKRTWRTDALKRAPARGGLADRIGNGTREPSPDRQDHGSPAPFSALLASGSVVVAVLLVAGFSYRWAYYYNFGLQDLAIGAPVQSIAMSALELVRRPDDALATFLIVAVPMVVFGAAVGAGRAFLARRQSSSGSGLLRKGIAGLLETPLIIDVARATLLMYAAYWAGSSAGVHKFKEHAVESASNALPRVTLPIAANPPSPGAPFGCRPVDWQQPQTPVQAQATVVGSAGPLVALSEGLSCNVPGQRSWRLLHRDEHFIYVFATGLGVARPTTLVIPQSDARFIVLNGE